MAFDSAPTSAKLRPHPMPLAAFLYGWDAWEAGVEAVRAEQVARFVLKSSDEIESAIVEQARQFAARQAKKVA